MPQEVTPLSPAEETQFRQWVATNGITDLDHPDSHYDYRGFWKQTKGAPHKKGDHYPDTFKQHGHPTFSVESQYSKGPGDGGTWKGDTFVPSQGNHMADEEVVIVDDQGTEHVFPAGFDPKKAAGIVRAQSIPSAKPPTAGEMLANVPIDESGAPLKGEGLGNALATNPLIQSAARPGSIEDLIALAVPEERAVANVGKALEPIGSALEKGAKALKKPLRLGGIFSGATGHIGPAIAEFVGPTVAEYAGKATQAAGRGLKAISEWETPFKFGETAPAVSSPATAMRMGSSAPGGGAALSAEDIAAMKKKGFTDAMIADIQSRGQAGKIGRDPLWKQQGLAGPQATAGRPPVVNRLNDLIRGDAETMSRLPPSRGLPEYKEPLITPAPMENDPSFIRSVPASYPVSERPALPPYKEPIVTKPPADPSRVTVTRAKKTDFPTRDPKSGRMRRTYTSASEGDVIEGEIIKETPETAVAPKAAEAKPAKSSLSTEVQTLTQEGFGAKEIADKLKSHPDLKSLSPAERINMVREARGGEAGQLPARVKGSIDSALKNLTTDEEKRAYLRRAPNAAVYNYVRQQLGL